MYTPSQLYSMTPEQLNGAVEEVLGIVGDYRDAEVFSQIVKKAKDLFMDHPFINTKSLKVDASLKPESPGHEITIGVILAYLGKDQPFN